MNKKEMTISSTTRHEFDSKDFGFDVNNFEKASAESFSTAIRVLMRNWRQGTVASQGRSDVSRTNRKPYKQKGTGRARAGDSKSPLWKGGGVIFGPQARVRTTKMPKKLKQKVMLTVLADYCNNNNIICADWAVTGDKPNTAQAQNLLKDLNIVDKKIVAFIAPHDFQAALSFANIPNVHPLSFDQVNAYDLTNSDCWLFLKKDFDYFKEMVSQWL
jgi:large subunit ribosomal protein L4